jgi:hypothetical protein
MRAKISSIQNEGLMHLDLMAGGLTYLLATGSKSLDDITLGLFLVKVINGSAGSGSDDSWQKGNLKGEGPEKGFWGGSCVLYLQTLQVKKLKVFGRFLRKDLIFSTHVVTQLLFSSRPSQNHTDLLVLGFVRSFGARCVCNVRSLARALSK